MVKKCILHFNQNKKRHKNLPKVDDVKRQKLDDDDIIELEPNSEIEILSTKDIGKDFKNVGIRLLFPKSKLKVDDNGIECLSTKNDMKDKVKMKTEGGFQWENCHIKFYDLNPFEYETMKSNLSQNNKNCVVYEYFHNINYTEVRSIFPSLWLTDEAIFCCLKFVTHRTRDLNNKVHIVHPALSKVLMNIEDPKTNLKNFTKFHRQLSSVYESNSLTLHPCKEKDHWTILYTFVSDEGMLGGIFDGQNNSIIPTPSCKKLFNKIAELKEIKNKEIYQQSSTPQMDGNSCGMRVVLAAKRMTSKILSDPKQMTKKMIFENSDRDIDELRSYILRRIAQMFFNF